MDAQIDHVTGSGLMQASGQPLECQATPEVLGDIATGLPLVGIPAITAVCRPTSCRRLRAALGLLPDSYAVLLATPSCRHIPPTAPRSRVGDNIGITLVNVATGVARFTRPAWAISVWLRLLAAMAANAGAGGRQLSGRGKK